PADLVHARRVLALVFRHSSHGQDPAAVRVGQQALQGFDLAPPALLCRLHDTRLEPAHDAMSFGPVNGVPVQRIMGSRTSPRISRGPGRARVCWDCHLLCLLCRLANLSRAERPEGSLPAFAWGDLT